MSKVTIKVETLEGPVSVAYRRSGKEWHAIALQFDIVGTGKSKAAAFREMQELLELYITEVLKAPKPVRFYNPSEQADWQLRDKAHFHVAMVLASTVQAPERPSLDDLAALRPLRSKIRGIQLQRA